MSFTGLLNHTCDIYHLIRTDTSPGYGLPASPAFSYPEAPDEASVPCHFGAKGGLTTSNNDPAQLLMAGIKLVMPLGTDIRINDKVVDLTTGVEYTAEAPRQIRQHHLYVMLHRTGRQEPI